MDPCLSLTYVLLSAVFQREPHLFIELNYAILFVNTVVSGCGIVHWEGNFVFRTSVFRVAGMWPYFTRCVCSPFNDVIIKSHCIASDHLTVMNWKSRGRKWTWGLI